MGVLTSTAPSLLVATFAACLALGFAPASGSLGLILSPMVESALRTVTPLPIPQIFIERPVSEPPSRAATTPILHRIAGQAPFPAMQPPASDVDIGVGAVLMVCKTLLLYLATASAFFGMRSLAQQVRARHTVTNLRVVSRRGGSADSVFTRSVQGVRLRRTPFGTSVSLDVSTRRRPFLLIGLGHWDAAEVNRTVSASLSDMPGTWPVPRHA